MDSLKLYNVKEAGELLHLTPRKIKDLINDKQLIASLTGNKYIITEESIKAYLKATENLQPPQNKKS